MEVWTYGYFPFTMGGDVWRPIKCDVSVAAGPFDLGAGYEGYLIVSPNGTTFVAELITGAFVGPNIESVREDILNSDIEMMKENIDHAKKDFKKATIETQDSFWNKLKALN